VAGPELTERTERTHHGLRYLFRVTSAVACVAACAGCGGDDNSGGVIGTNLDVTPTASGSGPRVAMEKGSSNGSAYTVDVHARDLVYAQFSISYDPAVVTVEDSDIKAGQLIEKHCPGEVASRITVNSTSVSASMAARRPRRFPPAISRTRSLATRAISRIW
jgi:hypothetical protein